MRVGMHCSGASAGWRAALAVLQIIHRQEIKVQTPEILEKFLSQLQDYQSKMHHTRTVSPLFHF